MSFFDDCIDAIDSCGPDFLKFKKVFDKYHDIIIIGNGGSNAIASHISQDYTKKAGKRARSFSDPSMLTCYMNDYGVDKAYEEFLDDFANEDTLIIFISSSGNSPNIINGILYCNENNIPYGILTAFDSNNKCRSAAKNALFDYYINTNSYGVAECVHQVFLHGVVE